ncbi:MAG: glycosyltransferase family 1 protein, partial [Endozoicomonas sp.]
MADLVVFGEDWGGLPSSTQHLIKHLLKKHRVIWVNSIGMRSPQLNRQDLFRLFHKAVNMLKPVQKKPWTVFNNSPLIINPKVIPFHGIKPIRCLNTYLLRRAILKVMGKEDFSDILLWISLPTAVDLVGRLGEKASLYYCGDDFEALDGVDHKIVAPLERKLVSCVDVVLVASEKLADKYPEKTPVILPHGVDFELFSKPMPRPFDLPAQGQIAGFYGSLSNWLDIEMLAQSATALSNWHFVFIGPVKTDISTLENLPNTHFLGPRPHSQLPSYVQHWDVALLPFRKTPQIRACNP